VSWARAPRDCGASPATVACGGYRGSGLPEIDHVQHVRADLEALRRLGGGDERRHRGEDVSEVIGHGQRGVAEILELAGLVRPLGPRGRAPNVDAEPERLHRQDTLGPQMSALQRRREGTRMATGARSPVSRIRVDIYL
jgi:hypothetical protein